jgi:predicted dienelactone hydrolase
MQELKVRALYRAAAVGGYPAPYNSITMKVYYPCAYGDSFEERNTGMIPVDSGRGPLPIVIIMPGVNVSHEAYAWLATLLAEAGFAVVTYSWITADAGVGVCVSPGLKLKRLSSRHFGRKPSCPAIKAILAELKVMQADSLLASQLRLDCIILGGHSAGGTLALVNANRKWFPGLRGAFSYAAHTAANVELGWPQDSIMPLAGDLPLLLMGGSEDGVIAASGHRYGDQQSASSTERVERTFHEGIPGSRGDRFLLIVEGANHFSFVHPQGTSTGRPYLDREVKGSRKRIRAYIGRLVLNFCDYACNDEALSRAEVEGLCDKRHPLAAVAAQK